ncbi:MAG: hypothetical protein HY293_04150 [Planctomycetes bacterium]|nr:hypothetical protein [Planctomycetota bacterium]
MIEASKRLTCVFVDCDWGKKNKDLSDKYKVTGYPTVVFCDPEGNFVTKMQGREPADVAKDFKTLADSYSGKREAPPIPEIVEVPFEQAREEARKKSKPVVYYFSDDSPASLSVNQAIIDPLLRDTFIRFVFAKTAYRKGSPECVKFDVNRAPTILVLDPKAERPEEKPLARITGSKTPRELKRELEAALPERAPEAAPASKPSAPSPREPEEKLSDDQVERLFIQARVAVARDLLKRGQKEKAVEVFEDIIKSYPKHVDTGAVRKLLEDARK